MIRRSGGLITRALAVFAMAVLVSSCTSDSTSGSASSQRRSDPSPTASRPNGSVGTSDTTQAGRGLDWSACSDVPGGECATLQVPLDWARPDGQTIDLAVGRIRATGERLGSVVMNPGGPGGSGLELLRDNPLSRNVTDHYDSVSWDPRGVGKSTSVDCAASVPAMLSLDPDPDSKAEQSALDSAAKKVSDDCEAVAGQLLAHVSTDDVARDLEAIRVALGDGKLNYLGFSYGTHIGQIYASLHPDQIRSMVLDGVVDPSEGFEEFLSGQTKAFDESFDRNSRACARAGIRRCGVKDLGESYDRLHYRVEARAIGSGDSRVGPAELATAAIMSAYWDNGWTRLGPALAEALKDRPRRLRTLADTYTDLAGYSPYAAVVCTDSPPPRGDQAYEQFADRLRAISPRLGGAIANELLPCATWPVKATGQARPITAPGAPPIIVIGNTGDPATPYSNAVKVAATLSSGVLVTADRAGHTAYGSDSCVTKVVDRYLVDLVVPQKDPHCR